MTKHPLEYQCPDCKGSGVYKGLNITLENCKTCDGHGSLIGVQLSETFTHPIVKEPYPKKTTKEGRVFLPKKGHVFLPGATECDRCGESVFIPTGTSRTQCLGLPRPFEGELVHVYDTGWYEAVIDVIYDDPKCRGGRLVKADHTCGVFRIPINDICWNDTEKRWEYIRSGTPV